MARLFWFYAEDLEDDKIDSLKIRKMEIQKCSIMCQIRRNADYIKKPKKYINKIKIEIEKLREDIDH